MNDGLIADVSALEAKDAIFSIKPASAPGPDGMSALFFQQFWDIVGPQVTSEVQKFFVDGSMPTEWNYTHLCLIPKRTHPTEMVNLRLSAFVLSSIKSFPRFWLRDFNLFCLRLFQRLSRLLFLKD